MSAPTSVPASHRVSARATARARDWLVVLCALLATGIYWTVWVHYTTVHTVDRFVATAPGEAVATDGQTLRLVSLVRTTTLVSDSEGAEPQIVQAGAEFVVAQVQLVADRDVEYGTCGLQLLGPDGRLWEDDSLVDVSRSKTGLCSDLKAGETRDLEFIYEVPSAFADDLYGLALIDDTSIEPSVVLTPPR